MALISTGGVSSRPPADVMPHRVYAAEGRIWAKEQGFPDELPEHLAVKAGYATAFLGPHLPDLAVELCEELGLSYRVKTTTTTKDGGSYVKRQVIVSPPPEPEPELEPPTPKRDYAKQRTEKIDLRLTAAEREELDAAAKAAHVPRGQFVRDLLISRINADHAWHGRAVDPEWLAQAEAKFERQRQRWRGRSRRRAS